MMNDAENPQIDLDEETQEIDELADEITEFGFGDWYDEILETACSAGEKFPELYQAGKKAGGRYFKMKQLDRLVVHFSTTQFDLLQIAAVAGIDGDGLSDCDLQCHAYLNGFRHGMVEAQGNEMVKANRVNQKPRLTE